MTGKVIGADWYRIERQDGDEAYVYAPLFVPPETLVAAAPAPAPSPAPASVPTQADPPAERVEPVQASAPSETVQTAAVTPGLAAPDKVPATRASAVPAPQVDAAALLQTLGQRKPNSKMRFMHQIRGEQGTGFVSFLRWKEVGSTDDAPSLVAASGARSRVQKSSETFGEAVMATQVAPEMFGVLMYSRATHGGRANFTPHSVASALSQWLFLNRHGARVETTSTTNFDGVRFEVASLTLNDGAPGSTCLGFVAFQGGKRVDGFVCRPAGPAFDVAQANAVVSQIRVPRFIEP